MNAGRARSRWVLAVTAIGLAAATALSPTAGARPIDGAKAASKHRLKHSRVAAASVTRPKRVLIVLFDGMRPEMANRFDMPNFRSLRDSGVNFKDAYVGHLHSVTVIAHNVIVGRHCLIMGQAGFAGSTRLGDYCVIASQSGIAGHLKLGTQATVGAKSGVMRDVPDKGTVLGIPAMPDRQMKRQFIAVQQLPDMIRRMRDLEKQVAELTAKTV